ncbi:hypothetical protein [Aliagarivorans taiwanensis]|uniref:hypothetical protein n=1 Tax=Aliagarivorans taiwanensis TaxID=561966 RepID=UPI000422A950|nr:hypothetical protein [Aliagarivorans taiwanensis]
MRIRARLNIPHTPRRADTYQQLSENEFRDVLNVVGAWLLDAHSSRPEQSLLETYHELLAHRALSAGAVSYQVVNPQVEPQKELSPSNAQDAAQDALPGGESAADDVIHIEGNFDDLAGGFIQ